MDFPKNKNSNSDTNTNYVIHDDIVQERVRYEQHKSGKTQLMSKI